MHYKMEWIYVRTKVSGPERLELTLEMKKKIEKCTLFASLETACSTIPAFPWMCGILIDRYSGRDHKYETIVSLSYYNLLYI